MAASHCKSWPFYTILSQLITKPPQMTIYNNSESNAIYMNGMQKATVKLIDSLHFQISASLWVYCECGPRWVPATIDKHDTYAL